MNKLGLRSKLRGIWPDMPAPISLWRFDDATGDDDLVDAIGANDLATGDIHTRVTGKIGHGTRLGGSASITTDDYNFITDPFTVLGLFKRSSGTDTLRVKYQGADIAWLVDITDVAIVMQADLAGAGLGDPDAYTTPSDTWTFVCGRYDGSSLFLNVNARTEVESAGVTTLSDQTGGTLTVTPSGTVDLDHWAICDYCMTDAQVYAAYKRLMAGASIW